MYLQLLGNTQSYGNCQAAEPGLPQQKVIKELQRTDGCLLCVKHSLLQGHWATHSP